jgi:hypothetical protein
MAANLFTFGAANGGSGDTEKRRLPQGKPYATVGASSQALVMASAGDCRYWRGESPNRSLNAVAKLAAFS